MRLAGERQNSSADCNLMHVRRITIHLPWPPVSWHTLLSLARFCREECSLASFLKSRRSITLGSIYVPNLNEQQAKLENWRTALIMQMFPIRTWRLPIGPSLVTRRFPPPRHPRYFSIVDLPPRHAYESYFQKRTPQMRIDLISMHSSACTSQAIIVSLHAASDMASISPLHVANGALTRTTSVDTGQVTNHTIHAQNAWFAVGISNSSWLQFLVTLRQCITHLPSLRLKNLAIACLRQHIIARAAPSDCT
jgi:hypothetical protein